MSSSGIGSRSVCGSKGERDMGSGREHLPTPVAGSSGVRPYLGQCPIGDRELELLIGRSSHDPTRSRAYRAGEARAGARAAREHAG